MTAIRFAVALAGSAIFSVAVGGVVLADHMRAVGEITVAPAANANAGYVISFELRTTDGRPLNNATVDFYENVDLFGARDMHIATARTDGQGVGSTTYLPARTGRHEIVMRFAGREHVAPVELKHGFDATIAAPPYRAHTPPLAAFSSRVPYGVGVVVFAVWALIGFALFGTAIGIRRGARIQSVKGMKEDIA